MLKITSEPIGKGRERACYVHPEDPRLAIKMPMGEVSDQTQRDLKFYGKLKKRGIKGIPHVPDFHGLCDTNLGRGIVVDLIRNYDGEISRPLNWYLAQGVPIEEFDQFLQELKQSFLQNLIIFNHDMTIGNLLFQKTSTASAQLVAIDGLGDVVAIDWFDHFPFLVRRKINRRWKRFMTRVYRTSEVKQQREGAAASDSAPSRWS
jgi:hypothetical protein